MTYRLVYDIGRRRPGCILIQAAMGCTVPSWKFYELFPAESWLVDDIDGCRVYEVNDAQLLQASKASIDAIPRKPDAV